MSWILDSVTILLLAANPPDVLPTASPAPVEQRAETFVVLGIAGTVEAQTHGNVSWTPARTNQVLKSGERLRTGRQSRALVRASSGSCLRLKELTTLTVRPPAPKGGVLLFQLESGATYFFDRDRAPGTRIGTPLVAGAIRGTEVLLEVGGAGETTLTVVEGVVEVNSRSGPISVSTGEQLVAAAGMAPQKRAAIDATGLIQWCLYYPAVVDPGELDFSEGERRALAVSLAAYRQGDVIAAVAAYPFDHPASSDADRIFRATLRLAVGQVKEAESELATVQTQGATNQTAQSLHTLIAATKFKKDALLPSGDVAQKSASAWLAESYYRQSRSQLWEAWHAASQAVSLAPTFGFARIRLAELEFSHGRVAEARASLSAGLDLAPRHAPGRALLGFVRAAENDIPGAIDAFNEAIAADSAVADAWLGRGLCRIRLGEGPAGLVDLETAAALEPQRAVLRSYLGKAFYHANRAEKAVHELGLAKDLDPNDPTAWLYSALVHRQQNRVNQAVRDLEKSIELNDNRSVFRSSLMLDQDRSIRRANLASIYRDAGMLDVSVRQGSRAVAEDYSNFAAHLFLANSYDQLRDPRQVNLRYETPWFTELLVANLLAPPEATALSQHISHQEYHRLFERDGLGFFSSTRYLSSGDWLQTASQYGTLGGTSYALDGLYGYESGYRPNEDLEQTAFYAKWKQRITPRGSLFFQAVYYDLEAGDLAQYYDPASAQRELRMRETHEPTLLAGYDHQWSPGVHTLFLAGRFYSEFSIRDPDHSVLLLGKDARQVVNFAMPYRMGWNNRGQSEIYSSELQQIVQKERHTTVAGLRYQAGEFESRSVLQDPLSLPIFPRPMPVQEVSPELERYAVYLYHSYRVFDPLLVTAGLVYDRLEYPFNHRRPPLSEAKEDVEQLSPKIGLVWQITPDTVLRGAYTRSLGGVSYDQSIRLEPTQVGGFNQAYRSIFPESLVGSVAAAEFRAYDLGLEQRFDLGTYLGVDVEWLESEAEQQRGVFEDVNLSLNFVPARTLQEIEYRERSILFTVNQLIGSHWSLGSRYRLTQADLDLRQPEIPMQVSPLARRDGEATLHQVDLSALWRHPSGWFSQIQSVWVAQSNSGSIESRPGDDFWQFNALVGYTLARRRVEVQFGLLNLTDQDYELNPLTSHAEFARERTFFASLKLNF